MTPVQEYAEQVLAHLEFIALPPAFETTLKLAAYKGRVQGQGVIQSNEIALDRFEFGLGTATVRMTSVNALIFDVYRGACRIHIGTEGDKDIVLLQPGHPYRLEPGEAFVLITESQACGLLVRCAI